MKSLKIICLKCIDVFFHGVHPNKNWILFTSFHGQYNDNPKYISIKLHEQYPNTKIFWEIGSKSKQNDIPDYINQVKFGTFKYYYVKNKCSVVVDNFAGFYMSSAIGRKRKIVGILKNKKQFNLSTSHGTPVKTLWAQDPESKITKDGFVTTSDMLIAGSQLSKKLYEMATGEKLPIVTIGTPRNDILFDTDENKIEHLKLKLGLPLNKKIVLYAPTWRTTPEDSGVIQIHQFKYDLLNQALMNRFGGEWVFVFRLHNLALKAANIDDLRREYGENYFYNGNDFDDMMEYMAVSDVLISDYSGAIYDWTLTKKPCFLFAHDRDVYENHGRGFYHTMDFFPYSFSNTFEELLTNIREFDETKFQSERKIFLNKIGNVEDGKASDRTVEIICKRMGH